jgi:hypothetical protein
MCREAVHAGIAVSPGVETEPPCAPGDGPAHDLSAKALSLSAWTRSLMVSCQAPIALTMRRNRRAPTSGAAMASALVLLIIRFLPCEPELVRSQRPGPGRRRPG